jgi:predicted phosphatase
VNTDPKVDPKLAVDIDPAKIKEAADATKAKLEAEQREKEAIQFLAAWERAGRKAWKGIFPAPWRRRMLATSLRRLEREQEDAS